MFKDEILQVYFPEKIGDTIFPRTFCLNGMYLRINYVHYGSDPYLVPIGPAPWMYPSYARAEKQLSNLKLSTVVWPT